MIYDIEFVLIKNHCVWIDQYNFYTIISEYHSILLIKFGSLFIRCNVSLWSKRVKAEICLLISTISYAVILKIGSVIILSTYNIPETFLWDTTSILHFFLLSGIGLLS